MIQWSSFQPTAKCPTCQHMMQPYTAIYAANNLIMVLTKPQPTNSFILIRDDQLGALRQLATIFQSSITRKPISDPGVPDIAPTHPHHPWTHSQTKELANAALTAPQGTMLFHTQPQPTDESKQEEDMVPDPPCDIQHNNKPRIIPIIANLYPQYPTKHEGLLEDPSPLSEPPTLSRTQTQVSNSSTSNSPITQTANYAKHGNARVQMNLDD